MILEVKKISKSFGGVQAVKDCSFALEEKKITALIGPNGAGKTTVFNIVNGFIAPDFGHVIFQNQDVTNLPAWERSRLGMSRTFQLSRLFKNLSLEENLILAARYDDDLFWKNLFKNSEASGIKQKIEETLELVGLKKDLKTRVTDLSYGEQKLFDITRALVNPHTMLLFDEPVAGVNPVIRERLKELMVRLKGGAAPNEGRASPRWPSGRESILLVEHDMDFVRGVADHVIVMDQGSVLVQGEPEKVLRDKQVLEAYLGIAV